MSEQRDELANEIADVYLSNMGAGPLAGKVTQFDLADAILAAGWTKPRTVKGYGELCALTYGSAVQTSDDSDTIVLRSDGMDFVNQSGHTVAAPVLWDFGSKPFFVLYEPTQ